MGLRVIITMSSMIDRTLSYKNKDGFYDEVPNHNLIVRSQKTILYLYTKPSEIT